MKNFLGAVIALFLLSLNSSSARITISNSTNERFITFGNEKLKVSLDYNLKCVITKLEVNGEPVILNKSGIYSEISTYHNVYSTCKLISSPKVKIDKSKITLYDINYGDDRSPINEIWHFILTEKDLKFNIERTIKKTILAKEASFPIINFKSINIWNGAFLDFGGIAWFYLFNEKLSTYGVHSGSSVFWNSDTGNGLKVSVSSPGKHVASKFTRSANDELIYAVSVTDNELGYRYDHTSKRSRYIKGKSDVWESTTISAGLIDPPGWRIADYAGGIMENDGQNIAANSLYYENLRIAANVSSVLGRTSEAKEYLARSIQLKAAINTHLLSGGNSYLTRLGSNQRLPLGAAWALRFDIVPPENKTAVAAWIRSQPIHIGGYGGEVFYSGTYSVGGLGDFIVDDLSRYKYMLSGNQTNWESFDQPSPENETNHAWTSYPAYLFQCYIAGIQPTGAAFSTFNIKPEIGGLTYAQATVPTVKGDISTRWDIVSPDKFTMSCTIPANSRALVHIPISNFSKAVICEGNNTIWENDNFMNPSSYISYEGKDDRFARFIVGSGSYQFSVTEDKKD